MQQRDSAAANDGTELRGQVAVVTGSSSGIGRAIAVEFARAGADVFVHAGRNEAAAAAVADEIRDLGRQSHVCIADLSDCDAHERLVDEAWNWATEISTRNDTARGVQTWVNNAGVDVLTGAASSWSFENKLARLWEVDVVATMRLSRINGTRMRAATKGTQRNDNRCILNMGWDQAETGMAGDSGEMFSAIKGAVMAFTKSFAHSLAPDIRVNCLAPGWIKTSWGDHASEYWDRRATSESLLGRWGTPQDVARVARFLAAPAASFLTGQCIPINGGFSGSTSDTQQS
jgi:3-oxoacyl-[acyl-carrier protein] reductase